MDENLREAAELPESGGTAPNEENEPETKSIRFVPSAYDPRGIEQWLSERAAEGKLLLRYDDFVIGEPRDCRYHLEPAADDDDPDELLREKRARLGWEYVCRTKDGIFYIWRGDKTAHVPTPKVCIDSYGYRTVRKKLLWNRLVPLILLLAIVVIFHWLVSKSDLPVHGLVTIGPDVTIQGAALLSSLIFGALSDAQERKNILALKHAMEDGERVGVAQRDRWATLGKVVSLIILVLPLVLGLVGRDTSAAEEHDTPPLPYISAEALGGDAADWYELREQKTPFGGRVSMLGEKPRAGTIENWRLYSTELDFYAPRISMLAAPLTHELRDYFMESGAQTLSIDGFDEAYYAEFIKPNTRFPNEPDEVRQFLILRRGGEVLYFRTEAPDSLREHLDEFADIFNQYSELA